MLPGVGTKDDIREAQDNGGSICRIATHCTEADVSIQHFGLARELGLETVGFLMMSHTQPPEVLAKQARIMVDAGCQCVYVVDSAGALIMEQASPTGSPRWSPRLGDDAQVGFHGHENLGLGVANTRRWPSAPGANQIDGVVPPLRRRRRQHAARGVRSASATSSASRPASTSSKIVDAAEDVVRPAMPEECLLDRMR